MIKKVLGLSMTAVMILGMTACGGSSTDSSSSASSSKSSSTTSASSSSTETGVEDGKFTVGFDAEYPPYGYKDENGEYTGFDLELAQAVCDKEGWELEKKPINWDSKDLELNSGSIDCIWN